MHATCLKMIFVSLGCSILTQCVPSWFGDALTPSTSKTWALKLRYHYIYFLIIKYFTTIGKQLNFCKPLVKFELSEKHTKFEKICLMVLTNQLIYLVNVKTIRQIFSNYVCFSKSRNFNLPFRYPKCGWNSSFRTFKCLERQLY